METRQLLLVVCLLGAGMAVVVDAQAQSAPAPPPRQTPSAPPQQTQFGRTMSTFITVAISVFFFLLFVCAYINQCRLADPGAAAAAAAVAAGGGGGGPSRRGKRGLDPAVVATFPIVSYREVVEHKVSKGYWSARCASRRSRTTMTTAYCRTAPTRSSPSVSTPGCSRGPRACSAAPTSRSRLRYRCWCRRWR